MASTHDSRVASSLGWVCGAQSHFAHSGIATGGVSLPAVSMPSMAF